MKIFVNRQTQGLTDLRDEIVVMIYLYSVIIKVIII